MFCVFLADPTWWSSASICHFLPFITIGVMSVLPRRARTASILSSLPNPIPSTRPDASWEFKKYLLSEHLPIKCNSLQARPSRFPWVNLSMSYKSKQHQSYTQKSPKGHLKALLPSLIVQSLSHVWVFVTPWTPALQPSLSFTSFMSQSLLKLTSIESMMPPTISSSVVPFYTDSENAN